MSKIYVGTDLMTLVDQDKSTDVTSADEYFHYDSTNKILKAVNFKEGPVTDTSPKTQGSPMLVPMATDSNDYYYYVFTKNTEAGGFEHYCDVALDATYTISTMQSVDATFYRIAPHLLYVKGKFKTPTSTPTKNKYYMFMKLTKLDGQATKTSMYPDFTMVNGTGGCRYYQYNSGVICCDYNGSFYVTFDTPAANQTFDFDMLIPFEFNGTTTSNTKIFV